MRSFSSWSLKTKLALGLGLLILLLSTAFVAWMLRTLEEDIRRSVITTQMTLARTTAADIDEKIDSRRMALKQIAALMAAEAPADAQLDRFFSGHSVFSGMFDSLAVTDLQGTVLYDTPPHPGAKGVNTSDRDYFRRAMSAPGEVAVSSPLASRISGAPLIVFAVAPAPGAAGAGRVLAGALNLNRPNFLGALGDARIGREGYFAVIDKGSPGDAGHPARPPVFVMHGHKSRILEPIPDAHGNPDLARALNSPEWTAQGVNSRGVDTLRAYAALRSVPWVLAVIYPSAEAFAGLRQRRVELLGMAAALFVLTAGSAWLVVARLLRPLGRFQQAIAGAGDDPELPSFDPGSAEVAAVVGAYRRQIDRRREVQARLVASEARLRAVADNLPAMVAHIDTGQRYTFVNARIGEVFGRPPQSFIGQTMRQARGEALYAELAPNIERALAGETVGFDGSVNVQGRLYHYRSDYIPDHDAAGRVCGFYAMTFDITARKEAELRQAASERQLRDLTNSIPAMVGYFDMQQRCIFANDTVVKALGIDAAAAPGMDLRAALGEASYAQHEASLREVLQGRRARFDGKVPFGGRDAYFQAHLIPDRSDGGAQRGFYLMSFDISTLKETQQRHAKVERQLRAITDNLPVLIAYIDRDLRYRFANAMTREWMNLEPEALLGRSVWELWTPAMVEARMPYIQRCLTGEKVAFETETDFTGAARHLQVVYVPDVQPDGSVAGFYAMNSDVTALKRAEQRLAALVRIDTLTGLANRFQFDEALPAALSRARRSGLAIALMFLDIDRFKQINDVHGHAAGDAALKEFARRLSGSVRSTDLAARLAGDEFVVILESLHDESEAQAVAGKILAAISVPFVGEVTLDVTTSLGIAYSRHADIDAATLLQHADTALYAAKAEGRNRQTLVMA